MSAIMNFDLGADLNFSLISDKTSCPRVELVVFVAHSHCHLSFKVCSKLSSDRFQCLLFIKNMHKLQGCTFLLIGYDFHLFSNIFCLFYLFYKY